MTHFFSLHIFIVADLTAFYRIVGVSSSMNINRKNKRKKIKLKIILGLCQSNIFLPMHVHACALFFLFSVHFANLIIFELNFFYLQSNRSLCQGSCVKTTAAVVFTPQLRSSG